MSSVAVIQCTINDLYKDNQNPDDYCISALKNSNFFDKIVLAAPKIGDYLVFKELASQWGVEYYFGSDYNVAERLYCAAKKFNPSIVIRVLLKRFYIDLKIVNKMINTVNNGYDYVTLSREVNYELTADVMSFKSLEKTVDVLKTQNNEFKWNRYRFSPWKFIEDNNDMFKTVELSYDSQWSAKKKENVKDKLKKLLSDEENMNFLTADNPASRYLFAKRWIDKNDRVLDIACGYGQGTKTISTFAKSAIGIDYNKKYISFAKKNNEMGNVNYILGSDNVLDKYPAYFDKIISLHTLEHVPNDKKFLINLHKSLKKDGRLILEVPRLMEIPLGEPLYPFHEREYKVKSLGMLLRKTGFNILEAFGGDRGQYTDISKAREVIVFYCKKVQL